MDLLEKAYAICKEELMYVYLGNVRTSTGADTLCPDCGNAKSDCVCELNKDEEEKEEKEQ